MHRQWSAFYRRSWRCANFGKMGATCVWWGSKMDSIRDIPYQSGAIWTWRKWHVESNYFNLWNLGTSIWTGTKQAIKRVASSWFTTKTRVTTKSITHEGHDHFGIRQPRYSRVLSCSWGPNCQCCVLQIISAVQSASYTAEEMPSTSKQCNNPPW